MIKYKDVRNRDNSIYICDKCGAEVKRRDMCIVKVDNNTKHLCEKHYKILINWLFNRKKGEK